MCDPDNFWLAIAHGIEALASAGKLSVRRAAYSPRLAEIYVAIQLADEQYVETSCDLRPERRSTDEILIQKRRAQIGKEMQLLAQPQHALLWAEPTVKCVVFPIAGRAEQDRIGLFGKSKRPVGKWIAARIVSRAANRRFFEFEGFAEAVQHLDRFSHDLRADAITGQHCDLHLNSCGQGLRGGWVSS
jgi:hypothetical protein